MTLWSELETMAPHLRLPQTIVLTVICVFCLAQPGSGAKLDHRQSAVYKTSSDKHPVLQSTPAELLYKGQSRRSVQKDTLKNQFKVNYDATNHYSKNNVSPYLIELYPIYRKEWKNFSVNIGGRRTFLGPVTTIRQHHHHETELVNHGSHHILHFNVSKSDFDDENIMTELKLFHNPSSSTIDFGHKSFDFIVPKSDNTRMKLFDISHLSINQIYLDLINSSTSREQLLHDFLIFDNSTRWLSIDLKNALQNISSYNNSHRRFSILVHHENANNNFKIIKRKRRHTDSNTGHKPFLLTYHRRKRSVSTMVSPVDNDDVNQPNNQNRFKRSTRVRHYAKRFNSTQRLCQTRKLYASFTKIGWQNYILLPEGYYANMCHGECEFPMSDAYKPTAHAIIQSVMHSLNPREVPPPCCVPIQMDSESLLQIEESGNYALKVYDNMVVKECGCR